MLEAEDELTNITPDWSPIHRVVIPYNRINTQKKTVKSNPRQEEVGTNVPT